MGWGVFNPLRWTCGGVPQLPGEEAGAWWGCEGQARPGSIRKCLKRVNLCVTRSGLYFENAFWGYKDMERTCWEATGGVQKEEREAEGEQSGGNCQVLGRET